MTVMARVPRHLIVENGSLFHVTWQCHNKTWLLKSPGIKKFYYQLLLRFKDRYGLVFYSYIFMENHIHLSGRLSDLYKFSAFFRIVNSLFAKEVNKRSRRCGQVVRDRFKSPHLETERDLIQEMIYHDLNEVRAGKSKHPENNEWSSYAHYAYGREDPLITDPEIYHGMGNTSQERQRAYRGMVEEILATAPRKKDGRYTQELFIGDPHWVAKKNEELKKLNAQLNRIRLYHSLAPPL